MYTDSIEQHSGTAGTSQGSRTARLMLFSFIARSKPAEHQPLSGKAPPQVSTIGV
jgi:hypothetical protein